MKGRNSRLVSSFLNISFVRTPRSLALDFHDALVEWPVSSISCSYLAHFPTSALKFLSKNVSYIFFQKTLLWKCFLYFLEKAFLIFRKRNFLTFWERYIQSPVIFRTRKHIQNPNRTRGIFRTLSNIHDGTFCKNSSLAHS